MTKFAYYVRKDVNSDGKQAVKIRMTHNRQSKFFPTSIYVTRNMLTRDGKRIKDARIEHLLNSMVQQYEEAFLTIKGSQFYTIDDLAATITERMRTTDGFRLDLFDFAERKMQGMAAKTAEGYRVALNAVRRFAKRDRLDINEISAKWVTDFRRFLETEPAVANGAGEYAKKSVGSRAVGYYMGCVRALHNMACAEYNDTDTDHVLIPKKPFARPGIIPTMPKTEHRALESWQVKAIMDCNPAKGSRAELARDVFVLSFALCGTNTVDLFDMKATDRRGDFITYCRAKTDSRRADKARVTMAVPEQVKPILDKYKPQRGNRLFSFYTRYSNSHEFNRAVNIGLKTVAELANLPEDVKLQSYHARHSWATIARNELHVDLNTVSAALVHSPLDKVTDIYLAPDFTHIWEAQRLVMEHVGRGGKTLTVKMVAQ